MSHLADSAANPIDPSTSAAVPSASLLWVRLAELKATIPWFSLEHPLLFVALRLISNNRIAALLLPGLGTVHLSLVGSTKGTLALLKPPFDFDRFAAETDAQNVRALFKL